MPCRSVSESPVTARQAITRTSGAPGQAGAAGPDGEPADHPVPGAGGLHRGVDDDHVLAGVRDADRGVEQLADDEGLVDPLLEAAQADRPGRELIAPGSTPVTRSIGTKIRRRVATSTTSPSTRGG